VPNHLEQVILKTIERNREALAPEGRP